MARMNAPTPATPTGTAVLAMDCQNGIIANYSKGDPDLIHRAAAVLEEARKAGHTVIHIRVGFRPGMPEVSARNAVFGAMKASPERQAFLAGENGEIHPALGPAADDIVVTKHRVSAFAGTDLEQILRANDVETLVLFGIATSGVVLSTVVDAFDADYRIVVLRDCCGDLDPEVHACLLDKIFPRRGTVISSAEFLASLTA